MRVESDDETASAMCVDQVSKAGLVADDSFRIQLCRCTDMQGGIALDNKKADGTISLNLKDEGAVEFDVAAQQGGCTNHFAQEPRDG